MSSVNNHEVSLLPVMRLEGEGGHVEELHPEAVAGLFHIATKNSFGTGTEGVGLAITQAVGIADSIESALANGETILIGRGTRFRVLELV